MKQIIYFSCLFLIISSCTSEIEDRIPAFQSTINGVEYWEAINFNFSTNALGEGIITGDDFNSSISLKFPSLSTGVYDLRDNIIGEATYQDTIQYSTLNDGISSIAYFSDGEISINEISSDSEISGTFTFNAYDSSGELTVNVSRGIFYRLPLTQTTD
jgi:hypothetical protein